MNDTPEMYQKALAAAAITTEITCAKATALCKIYGFETTAFRAFCDGKKIKFTECRFGCFK